MNKGLTNNELRHLNDLLIKANSIQLHAIRNLKVLLKAIRGEE